MLKVWMPAWHRGKNTRFMVKKKNEILLIPFILSVFIVSAKLNQTNVFEYTYNQTNIFEYTYKLVSDYTTQYSFYCHDGLLHRPWMIVYEKLWFQLFFEA